MKEGLLPIQWVKQYGQHFLCNSSTPFNISLSKHMYFTILLSRDIFEPNFTFKMTFALQTEIAAGKMVMLNGLNAASASNNCDDQHPKIYVAKPNMFLKVHFKSFLYLGFKSNIKKSQIRFLPHSVSDLYEDILPTGSMYYFLLQTAHLFTMFCLLYIANMSVSPIKTSDIPYLNMNYRYHNMALTKAIKATTFL
jgi:hypothetical protein